MKNKYDLQINEKVKLISGGADMILKEFTPDTNQVVCFWISDEGQYYERAFDLEVIVPSDYNKRIMVDLELNRL